MLKKLIKNLRKVFTYLESQGLLAPMQSQEILKMLDVEEGT